MVIDLRNVASTSPTLEWFSEPQRFRSIGASYDDNAPDTYFYEANLTEEFDAIIYIEETTPSVLLP